jgi:hypothetical protein
MTLLKVKRLLLLALRNGDPENLIKIDGLNLSENGGVT